MKVKETPPSDVGIVIGRFQVPNLHEAHLELIQSVVDRHKKVIIFLGLSPAKTTYRNPLDFEARKQMLADAFPCVSILYIKDQKEDKIWSANLDTQINDLVGPTQTCTLYGSRDSFIPHYTGQFPVLELEPERVVSGKEIRKDVGRATKGTEDFRKGVIWAVENQFPAFYPTCDVAIVDKDNNRLLLGKKPGENEYRFPGGFADPTKDASMEAVVYRETREECGDIEIGKPTYLGSVMVNDWRYRNERNKIMTFFFMVNIQYGRVEAGDDLAEVRWFDIDKINEIPLVKGHIPLMEMLVDNLKKEKCLKKGNLYSVMAKSLNNTLKENSKKMPENNKIYTIDDLPSGG